MSKLNAKEFIEGLEGYNVDCILDDEDLKLAVISIMEKYHQSKLKNNGGLGDAEEDHEFQRLYNWLTDPNRKPANTTFTASMLRNVAREIEFLINRN